MRIWLNRVLMVGCSVIAGWCAAKLFMLGYPYLAAGAALTFLVLVIVRGLSLHKRGLI